MRTIHTRSGRKSWRARLLRLLVSSTLLLGLAPAALVLSSGGCAHEKKATVLYHCPMHPTYISDKPGNCPICGMRLVPIQGDSTEVGGSTTAESPGMEMDEEGAPEGRTSSDHAPVTVSPEGARMAGIRTIAASRGALTRTVRGVGQVLSDERRVHEVTLKSAGYVERLFVSATGQWVRRGEPILSIYSPELLAAQSEYLRARAVVLELKGSQMPDVRRGAEDLFHASEERLQLLDVPDSLLRKIERTGEPERTVTLTAPVSGYVMTKPVVAGMRVEPGTGLYTVADLSEVWIEVDFYESEAALHKVGEEARLTLPYAPSWNVTGRISLIYPQVDPASRTVRARFEVENPDFALKPGMYANAILEIPSQEGILVPDDAVLDTGERQLVFVETSPGTFTPRSVRVGLRSDGEALLLQGVEEGENVVVRANFLLDSESRIRAAFSENEK